MVDLVERLQNLFEQEERYYTCDDYLSPAFQEQLVKDSQPEITLSSDTSSTSSSCTTNSTSKINQMWREKICEWSYQVVDHFDFSREVVSISISYLDRYLSTRVVDKKLFQLAAMTTLYLAIKLYEPKTLTMSSLIELSRGYFMVEQMSSMEREILNNLKWHVHPPTQCVFTRHLLHVLPANACPPTTRHDILEMARFLTELSVCDYFFVTKKSSTIALAALLIAMDMSLSDIHYSSYCMFLTFLRNQLNVDPDDEDVQACRDRLQDLYSQGGYASAQEEDIATGTKDPVHEDEISSNHPTVDRDTISPVCVGAATFN